jgi:hypothetical protein
MQSHPTFVEWLFAFKSILSRIFVDMAPTEAEMKEVFTRLNGHDSHITSLNLVVFGNDTMHVVGMAERLSMIEKMLTELIAWQRDVKLLLKVGIGLLTVITGGTGVIAWPQLVAILAKVAGG